MWELACVGAGLLAIAVCQCQMDCLTHRYREQARSHILTAYILGIELF